MREEIASIVFPVLTYGIHLKERITSDEPPDLGNAQSELQGLLSDGAAARFPDFVGAGSMSGGFGRASTGGERFLGIRYALVCWLDEIMIRDTAWKDDWTDRTLEQALYESRDRAWNFWVQADRAAREGRTDALEAFYLCAMLGFRGEKQERPDELQAKLREYQEQIDSGGGKDWPGPVGGQPRVFAPPLTGQEHKKRMLRWAITALLVVIPVIVFCLVYAFRG
jgi:type VI secretion system protein ImpK